MLFYGRKLLHICSSALVVIVLSITTASVDADSHTPVFLQTTGLASSISELEFRQIQIGDQTSRRFLLTHTGLTGAAEITIYSAWLDETDALSFSSDFDGPVTLASGESVSIEGLLSSLQSRGYHWNPDVVS